jgi:glycosyltransferase involved in cell wall biosynthesis
VNNKAPSTGVGVYAYELFNHLSRIAPDRVGLLDILQGSRDGEPSIRKMMRHFSMFWKIPRDDHPLVLHFLSANLGSGVALRKPCIFTLHDLASFLRPLNRERVAWSKGRDFPLLMAMRLNSYLVKFSNLVICQTHTTAVEASRFLNLDRSRIRVIYPGVNHEEFCPRPKAAARSYLHLPLHKKVILNVSVDEPRKNIDTLLRAFRVVARAHPDTILVRIGRHTEDTERLIHLLGIQDKIVHVENAERTAPYYNAADVFAFPSLYEGLGRPLLESMASGCPIVASNVQPIPEVLGDAGVTGNPLDTDGFARMLSPFIAGADKGYVEDQIRKGLERSKSFDWGTCAKETYSLYCQLLD